MEPKYKLGQTVYTLEDGGILKANINGITIRHTENFTHCVYQLYRMRHGQRVDGHYESDIFESPESLIKNLESKNISDETTYTNGGTLPTAIKR